MRLWTLHPKHLDSKGLVALWREALLAQRILRGKTRGYRHHPQLDRFKAQPDPPAAIAAYLEGVLEEAKARGYSFDASKILSTPSDVTAIEATEGQLLYEWRHLLAKLEQRDRPWYARQQRFDAPESHPLFRVVPGGIADWERTE